MAREEEKKLWENKVKEVEKFFKVALINAQTTVREEEKKLWENKIKEVNESHHEEKETWDNRARELEHSRAKDRETIAAYETELEDREREKEKRKSLNTTTTSTTRAKVSWLSQHPPKPWIVAYGWLLAANLFGLVYWSLDLGTFRDFLNLLPLNMTLMVILWVGLRGLIKLVVLAVGEEKGGVTGSSC